MSDDRKARKLVLCFDGTGNKFHGDDSDSNILKIFRMLDRTADDQYHYYQPGIGTYVASASLSHTSVGARVRSAVTKAKDSALGSSLDQHVVGGYRFLMRFYNPGDDIYIFGFSRGAYIARLLAEMLDYVGLLSHGNEEMVLFAWKAFSAWQCRRGDNGDGKHRASHNHDGYNDHRNYDNHGKRQGEDKASAPKHAMYEFMTGFRETFARPVRRIRFLGLFDSVNSVPRFETAWMTRTKFPYSARSSARTIRHAVSVDEHRAKFRQDLLYQRPPGQQHGGAKAHRGRTKRRRHRLASVLRPAMARLSPASLLSPEAAVAPVAVDAVDAVDAAPDGPDAGTPDAMPNLNDNNLDDSAPAPYRPRSHSRAPSHASVRPTSRAGGDNGSTYSRAPLSSCGSADGNDVEGDGGNDGNEDNDGDDNTAPQDIVEVFFAGDHSDVGGGWDITPGTKSASHVPLAWMVREAMRAGLTFDAAKVVAMGCSDVFEGQDGANRLDAGARADDVEKVATPTSGEKHAVVPTIVVGAVPMGVPMGEGGRVEEASVSRDETASADRDLACTRAHFHDMMHRAHTAPVHDSLTYGGGLSMAAVSLWKVMEFLPFRRMDLQPDGSWRPIRWPLPCGEVRDIPDGVLVHASVLRRMRDDPHYRPGNLIVGGGGRGRRHAPPDAGMGQWECVAEPGDVIGELWQKKRM